MQLRDDFVAVTVPATSANLGPGFDSLGLALELHDTVSVHATTGATSVTIEGEGAGSVPEDDSNLVVRALRLALDHVGAPQVGVRMHCTNRIPHGHGLGSSASALVAGFALARALVGDPEVLGAADLLQLGTDVEGHPDNVAPAVLGGATIAWTEGGRAGAVRVDPPSFLRPVAFIPSFSLSTSAARSVLPAVVAHADAAYNVARAALLAAVLSCGEAGPAAVLSGDADEGGGRGPPAGGGGPPPGGGGRSRSRPWAADGRHGGPTASGAAAVVHGAVGGAGGLAARGRIPGRRLGRRPDRALTGGGLGGGARPGGVRGMERAAPARRRRRGPPDPRAVGRSASLKSPARCDVVLTGGSGASAG